MFAPEWRGQGVWHSFPFLTWDLSMQPGTHIWIFNQFICIRACACSTNSNCAHKCIENTINAYKCPNEPRKIPKIDTTLLLFYVDNRNFLKAIRRSRYRFVPKGGTYPTENIRLVVRAFGLWEAYPQTCPKWDNIFTMACRCHSIISCQVSWISDEFSIY